MNIRKAKFEELDVIMDIYVYARQFMMKNGNTTQWGEGRPSRDRIKQDIDLGVCYVCEDSDGIQGVFAFILGDDPTYAVIENGNWINEKPYGTIHRLASAGGVKGIATLCFDWCYEKHPNVRIDTHEDNKIMQHLIEKNSYEKCGCIFTDDGTPRIAYQKCY
jgi:RimJ/RimL family protein N-acetyltransferase